MSLSTDIARRYLFGKKSVNAINIINWISVAGVAIGTAALILILSVFNGFEGLISSLFNSFNPDFKVTPIEGKVFADNPEMLNDLLSIEGVLEVSRTLEEIVLFQYDKVQEVGTIKGVDASFSKVTAIDSTIRKGKFILEQDGVNYGVSGLGIANKLGISLDEGFSPIVTYIPRLKSANPFSDKYNSQIMYPSGTFSVQTEEDYQTIIASLDFVKNLREDQNSISSYELRIDPDFREKTLRGAIQKVLGENFEIKNRFQQDEAFLKLMNIEKWVSYALAGFAFVLIAFNLVGCLWMIVLEKTKDISILRAMGYTPNGIQALFILEGLFICGLGIIIGLSGSLIFYFLQKQFGIIGIPEGFIIDAYPVELRFTDTLVVIATVLSIGFLASLPGSYRAKSIRAFVREE